MAKAPSLKALLKQAQRAGLQPQVLDAPQAAPRKQREPWPDGACFSLTCEAVVEDAGTDRARVCGAPARRYKWHWALCVRCSEHPSYTLSSAHSVYLRAVARSTRL